MKVSELIYRLSYQMHCHGDMDVSFAILDRNLVRKPLSKKVVFIEKDLCDIEILLKEEEE